MVELEDARARDRGQHPPTGFDAKPRPPRLRLGDALRDPARVDHRAVQGADHRQLRSRLRDAAIPRREFLRGAGAAAAATLLAACAPSNPLASPASRTSPAPQPSGGPGDSSAAPTTAGLVTLGSNQSDPVPKAALQQVVDAFTATSGIDVRVNTTDHAAFQNQLSNYLQGKPDDVFTWFAGYRMRFFADEDLVGEVSDVWTELRAHYGEGVR